MHRFQFKYADRIVECRSRAGGIRRGRQATGCYVIKMYACARVRVEVHLRNGKVEA
jgi:hypothetical protein